MNGPVALTAARILRQMREYGNGTPSPDSDQMRIGREAARSVVVVYDHLEQTLHTVDSMLTAGASHGTLHTIIEQALDALAARSPSRTEREQDD